MARYDYLCTECETEFEREHSMKENPKYKCPECGSKSVERLISPTVGFDLRGDGFHKNDYDQYGRVASSNKPSIPLERFKDAGAI